MYKKVKETRSGEEDYEFYMVDCNEKTLTMFESSWDDFGNANFWFVNKYEPINWMISEANIDFTAPMQSVKIATSKLEKWIENFLDLILVDEYKQIKERKEKFKEKFGGKNPNKTVRNVQEVFDKAKNLFYDADDAYEELSDGI